MNATRVFVGLVFWLLTSGCADALPPSVEFDKLSLDARNALQVKDFVRAESALNKLRDFEFKLPDSYWYLLGTTQMELQKYKSASRSFEKYLSLFGNQGKFYKEALEGLSASERAYDDGIKRQAAEQSSYEQRLESCVYEKMNDCSSKCGNRPNSRASNKEIGECMLDRCGYAPAWTGVGGNNDRQKGGEYVMSVCRQSHSAPARKSFE